MSDQFTPGPWEISNAGSGRDGKLIYDETYVYAPNCGVDDIAIASDIADPLGGSALPNARLIASAPDLLAALIVLVEAGGIGPESMFHDARAAIAKATGQEPA